MRARIRHAPLISLAGAFLLALAAMRCGGSGGADAASDAALGPACATIADCVVHRPPSKCEGSSSVLYYAGDLCVEGHCQYSVEHKACACSRLTEDCALGLLDPGEAGALDAQHDPPTDSPDPPAQPCEVVDAGEAGVDSDGGSCDLPPSVCADPWWIVYYINPSCAGGECRWEKRYELCPGVYGCHAGACGYNFTQ